MGLTELNFWCVFLVLFFQLIISAELYRPAFSILPCLCIYMCAKVCVLCGWTARKSPHTTKLLGIRLWYVIMRTMYYNLLCVCVCVCETYLLVMQWAQAHQNKTAIGWKKSLNFHRGFNSSICFVNLLRMQSGMAERRLSWAASAYNVHYLSGPISRDIAILSLRYPISRPRNHSASIITLPSQLLALATSMPPPCARHRHDKLLANQLSVLEVL